MQSGEDVFSVFFYGSNNSDSVVSGNAAFREIKDHSLRMTPFQKKKKKKAMEVLGLSLPYIKHEFHSYVITHQS